MKIGDLFIKLGLQKKEFDQGLDDAKRKTSAFGDGMKKIGGMIAGVFAVGAITSFLKEASQVAAETENVRKAFIRLGGGSYFNELNNAVRGTLSQVDLMKNTIQATNFGIPIKDLANLFKFATEKASQTGQSVEYLTQSIVLGIGRKSVLILDNLGISAVALKEKLGSVGAEAASVGDVAAAIGQIADESFKKMGEQATTTAQKIDNISGSWQNIKVAIGDAINQNEIFAGGIKALSDYLSVFSKQAANAMTNASIRVKSFMAGLPNDIASQKEAIKVELQRINDEVIKIRSKNSWTDFLTLGGKIARDERNQEINTLKNQAIELAGIFDNLKGKVEPVELMQRIKDLELLISLEKRLASQKGISAEEAVTHANAIKKAEEELKTLREIAGIKEHKTAVQQLADLKAINDELEAQRILRQEGRNDRFTPMTTIGFSGFKVEEQDKEPNFISSEIFQQQRLSGLMKNMTDEILAEAQAFTDELNQIISSGITNAIESLATGLTELAIGDIGGKQFGAQILSMVGNFMVQIGIAFITFSKLFIAFQSAISSMNGPLALGIGISLVAAGAAISTIAKKGMSGGSGGGSHAASGYSSANYSQSSGAAVLSGNVVFELDGYKLKGALNNTDRRNTLIR